MRYIIISQTTKRKKQEVYKMLGLEEKKQQEIKHMVTILEQIDLPDILLLARDANTLLLRQQEAEILNKKAG